jgi:hypothetical protein
MAENERQLGLLQIAIHDVQISPANAAGTHFEQDLFGVWAWSGQVGEPQRIALGTQNHGLHVHPPRSLPTGETGFLRVFGPGPCCPQQSARKQA